MPTKHTRKKTEDKDTDLPPTQLAKALSTQKGASSNGIFTTEIEAPRKAASKRKRNADKADDTPKAFARLMAFSQGKRLPKSLDDGIRPTKKQKKAENAAKSDQDGEPSKAKAEVAASKPEVPTIRPGEKMSEFSARVDAALPISGLMNKTGRGGKDPLGLKQFRTKKEKKMHRMYDEWRAEEVKIQEKRQEALELAAEEADSDNDDGPAKWRKVAPEDDPDLVENQIGGKKKKKGKKGKKRVVGEIKEKDDDDPWAIIKKNRNEAPIGLNDVALAPPQLRAIKPKFKVRAGAMVEVGDVPKASGSLAKREQLGEERLNVIESYRRMMKERKEQTTA